MDQSRLKSLQQENPEYFSEILPYIYALNVKNIWTKETELVLDKLPAWYVGEFHHFPVQRYHRFLRRTSASVNRKSSSSSGHSSGGGGVSGGGAGGGGGHSW